MHRTTRKATLAALAGLTSIATLLAGCANTGRSRDLANPAVSGLTLAQQVCANCHGLNGHPTSPNFPTLAGQPAGYLAEQLKAFRDHSRHDPSAQAYMWGIARSLSDDQIDALASYYARQPMRLADTP